MLAPDERFRPGDVVNISGQLCLIYQAADKSLRNVILDGRAVEGAMRDGELCPRECEGDGQPLFNLCDLLQQLRQ